MISSKQDSFFHQELALHSKMSMSTTVFSYSVTRVVASSMISLERLRKISAHCTQGLKSQISELQIFIYDDSYI